MPPKKPIRRELALHMRDDPVEGQKIADQFRAAATKYLSQEEFRRRGFYPIFEPEEEEPQLPSWRAVGQGMRKGTVPEIESLYIDRANIPGVQKAIRLYQLGRLSPKGMQNVRNWFTPKYEGKLFHWETVGRPAGAFGKYYELGNQAKGAGVKVGRTAGELEFLESLGRAVKGTATGRADDMLLGMETFASDPLLRKYAPKWLTRPGGEMLMQTHKKSVPWGEFRRLDKKEQTKLLRKWYKGVEEIKALSKRYGLSHGDIHSQNVVMSPKGDPLLLDFGHIRALAGEVGSEHTAEGVARQLRVLVEQRADPEAVAKALSGKTATPASVPKPVGPLRQPTPIEQAFKENARKKMEEAVGFKDPFKKWKDQQRWDAQAKAMLKE
jgi:hypothetical protein